MMQLIYNRNEANNIINNFLAELNPKVLKIVTLSV